MKLTCATPSYLALEGKLSNRFCYWQGRSGRRYIHTIYPAGSCPPLPGAVYIAVDRMSDGLCRPRALGRFSPIWELAGRPEDEALRGCELHVHLLAGSDGEAQAALRDIAAGIGIPVRKAGQGNGRVSLPGSSRAAARASSRGSRRPISEMWLAAERT